MKSATSKLKSKNDLSLFVNGPLYRFYLLTGLATDQLKLYKRRIIIICMFVWLPLFTFTIFDRVIYTSVTIPFIFDIDVHIRFLIALPLLIYGEVVANAWLKIIEKKLLENNIILEKDRNNFNSVIQSTMQSTNSYIVEIVLIIFVLFVGYHISNEYMPVNVSTWYSSIVDGHVKLRLAGFWYAFISLPVFQFLLLRWYYRLILWYQFLWQVSRLRLQLNSLHPDRAGGLGFLNLSIYALSPFLLAHSVLLSGMIFNRIWNAHFQLMQFQYDVIWIICLLVLLPLIPLLFFSFILAETKRMGTLKYGTFSQYYVNNFRRKWLDDMQKDEAILGTPDIQSLSDLGNSFDVSKKMRIAPFNWSDVVQILILICLPLLPLAFLNMPIEKIITQVIKLIF